MIEVRQKIRQNVEDVREFIVSEDDIARIIKIRKNWTAPGICSFKNFCWKLFEVCWERAGER